MVLPLSKLHLVCGMQNQTKGYKLPVHLVQSIPSKSYRLVQFIKLKIYRLVQFAIVIH